MGSNLTSNNCDQTLSSKSLCVGGFIVSHVLDFRMEGFYLCTVTRLLSMEIFHKVCLVQLSELKTLYDAIAHVGLDFTNLLLVAMNA